MENNPEYMENITQKLKLFQARVQQEGVNPSTVRFLQGLLKLMNFGFDLNMVDGQNEEYPGIDLYSLEDGVAYHITTSFSSMELRVLQGKFHDSKLYEKFRILIILQLSDSDILADKIYRYPYYIDAETGRMQRYSLRTEGLSYLIERANRRTAGTQKRISDYLDQNLKEFLSKPVQPADDTDSMGDAADAGNKEKPFVFISYSHLDSDRAQEIVNALGAKGMRVWWDQDIEPGTPWDETIGNHLFDCKCVVALVTGNFTKSEACLDEIYVGKMKDKLLMVYLENLELPPKMYRYMRIQDIRFPADATVGNICERLSKTELLRECYIQ